MKIRLLLFSAGIILTFAGCTLIELPFLVTGEVIGDTVIIVAEVGEAL
ncbi:MAG: hypothetical protein WCP55_02655 [Lentisphaerota bacterium]|jgi:hypothetical protein